MNTDIDAIATWAFKHGLKLNESKTQTILIGISRLLSAIDLNNSPTLILNGRPLSYSDKVVGVVLYTLPLTIPSSFAFRRYIMPCPIFPRSVRPLLHLTLPCAADETSRYHIAFRFFPHKPYLLLSSPTRPPNSYIPYILQRRFTQVGTFSLMTTDP
ncbi:hypothetical protein J6590_090572 [Homalodisca vitripennis]|nr:hypothetical protein J6590_090572 [Homalodisca vitripennis]